MSAPKRLVVVDDDPDVRALLEKAFASEEFQVQSFADPRDALMKLHDYEPDLILCDVMMEDMDGRTFFDVVKRSKMLQDIPFVFLSGLDDEDAIVAILDHGADDVMMKPFSVRRLVARIRALLRLAERRRDAVSGVVGSDGPLALLRFCEENHLTGRLSIDWQGEHRFADFEGGELMHAGGTPEADDPIDALLLLREGTYRIERKRLDRDALREGRSGPPELVRDLPAPEQALAERPAGAVPLPAGRLSRVVVRGNAVQIQTECENRPNFTVTTVLVRDGQVMRKIESGWGHPLQRRADLDAARLQVDRQHERVAATLRELEPVDAPPPAEAGGAANVDGALLAWAVSFVAEQVRDSLGTVMTVALMRRTLKERLASDACLRPFRAGEDGRVVVPPGQEAQPAECVDAVGRWVVALLGAAGELSDKAGNVRVRQVTRMMETELERVGFYSAVDAARA